MLHDSIQAESGTLPLVSVIMPVYNTQDFLAVAIRSVLEQTYTNFELICIDDGSTDDSLSIIRSFACKDARISYMSIENHGQGYVRNMAVRMAKGKYIQFLDADDYLHPFTLELAVTRAEADESDLVIYDWMYFEPVGQAPKYVNMDALFSRSVLEGEECLEMLSISPYFTVNKLYRKSFLTDNGVVYGEDYIYEDIPFWVKVSLSASKVSTIHSPLYRVTINQSSTTKTDLGTDKHCRGFVLAVEEIVRDFEKHPSNADARYTVMLYLLSKFGYYYTVRTPKHLKKDFLRNFVNAIAPLDVEDMGRDKYMSSYLARNIFRERKYSAFARLINYYYIKKPKLKKHYTRITEKSKSLLKKVYYKLFPKKIPEDKWRKYNSYTKQSLYNDVILFMGFDNRYTGNSRYLFEEMIRRQTDKKIFFVTNDVRVPLQYRIEPDSDRAIRFIARAKVVIFESWIPLRYVKRAGAVWVQLWHGTPLKKMLFDSHERAIITRNPNQKINKFKDINRWSYLVTDNSSIDTYFETSFLIPKRKLLSYGYPRVKYLLENKDNRFYIDNLKELYGIPKNKKTVLYLPTWRDYNYSVEEGDFDVSYLLAPDLLQERLGEDYHVIYKDHVFLSKSELVNYPNLDSAETQELLLICDYVITDYSSVMFDALAIDLPVILCCNDFERNEQERGVYKEMWADISALNVSNLDEAVKTIKEYPHSEACRKIKEKYCYKSDGDLCSFILEL